MYIATSYSYSKQHFLDHLHNTHRPDFGIGEHLDYEDLNYLKIRNQ